MTRKTPIKPRKYASQDRSRATVDALVEATARILVKEGFHKASTNRIAEAAGVSIGSLYQYYSCKEALVVAVIDRHNQEIMQLVRAALNEVASQPVERAMGRLVAVAIEAHRIDPKLHRVIAEQIPRIGKLENLEAFNRETYVRFKAYLERHANELRIADLDLATFVCVTSIEALAHNAVLKGSEALSAEMVRTLIEETTRLVVGYLLESA